MSNPSIISRLQEVSVPVLGSIGDTTSVFSAWKPLILVATQPTLKVNVSSISECRSKWIQICSYWRLFQEDELLLSASGFSGIGWTRVGSTRVEELPFLVCRYENEPDIVLLNASQTRLAAITTEENWFYLFAAYKGKGADEWVICTEGELLNEV